MLVDSEIRQAIDSGEIKVEPFDPTLINPASLDISLSENFSILYTTNIESRPVPYDYCGYCAGGLQTEPVINPLNKSSFKFEPFQFKEYVLEAGKTVLAGMLEKVTLPDNIGCKVMGKSSLGRLGLINSSHAGWVDPGWSGYLTMELTNVSAFPIKLTAGMKIGQLVFYEAKEYAEEGYDKTGRYYNQASGTGSYGI